MTVNTKHIQLSVILRPLTRPQKALCQLKKFQEQNLNILPTLATVNFGKTAKYHTL